MTNFSHLFRSFHNILQFHKKLLQCFSTFIFLQVGNNIGPNNVKNIQIFHKCTHFLCTCPEYIRFWLTWSSLLSFTSFSLILLYDTLCHACIWPCSTQYTNTVHSPKKIFKLFLVTRKTGILQSIYEVWAAQWKLPINLHFCITKVFLKKTSPHGNVVRHWLRNDAGLLHRVKYSCWAIRAYSRGQSLKNSLSELYPTQTSYPLSR